MTQNTLKRKINPENVFSSTCCSPSPSPLPKTPENYGHVLKKSFCLPLPLPDIIIRIKIKLFRRLWIRNMELILGTEPRTDLILGPVTTIARHLSVGNNEIILFKTLFKPYPRIYWLRLIELCVECRILRNF